MTDPATESDPLDVVAEFGAAWANHDLNAAMALITDDCLFDNTSPPPDGTRCVGRDEIRQAWSPIFNDVRTQFEPEETFAAGDRVIQLWRYTWSDGHVRGVDVFRVRGSKIAEKRSYVKG